MSGLMDIPLMQWVEAVEVVVSMPVLAIVLWQQRMTAKKIDKLPCQQNHSEHGCRRCAR